MEETAELVQINFEKVLPSRAYTCVVLEGEEKKFAIYTDPSSGRAMQNYLTSTEKERPTTHDLMNQVFRGLDIKPKHVVINGLDDTIYFARLFLEQTVGEVVNIVEIDARPSDCITLALLHKIPIYCTKEVLDQTIAYAE